MRPKANIELNLPKRTASYPKRPVNRNSRIIMRRATFVLGLTSSAIVVALVALVYGIGSHRSSSTVEPGREEANQAQQNSSIDAEVNESTEVVPQQSLDSDQNPTVTEARRSISHDDEASTRKWVRETATQEVPKSYPLILANLDLNQSEKDALISFLIEDYIATTRTRYSSGEGIDEPERSNRLAAIIGDSKLQQFLALEHNLNEYRELHRVQSMLQKVDVPLTDKQRDGLLEILVDVREQDRAMPGVVAERNSIEPLEQTLAQIDEYERLVMELAPGVLSPEQVQYLFKRFETLSYRRADSLEAQKQARADNPTAELHLGYPARDD